MEAKVCTTLIELIESVNEDYETWNTKTLPWFRGEKFKTDYPLTPELYRDKQYSEIQLLHDFRLKAPLLTDFQIPQQGCTDQWLFLAQHHGIPTRLLDWTEGLLIALLFAMKEFEKDEHAEKVTVWMLNPIELNRLTKADIEDNEFEATWYSPDLDPVRWIQEILQPDERNKQENINKIFDVETRLRTGSIKSNYANINIRAAWEQSDVGTEFPVAIKPPYIHERFNAQRSCFTIWGKSKTSLIKQTGDKDILKQYVFYPDVNRVNKQLTLLGVTSTNINYDMDTLSRELKDLHVK